MRVAVASQNFREITGHGGRARRFLVYQAQPGNEPLEVERLDLPKEMAMHEFQDNGPHPLDQVQLLIVGSAGDGFVRRLGARGIKVAITGEIDPVKAVRDYFAGTLTPPLPHQQHECHCHH